MLSLEVDDDDLAIRRELTQRMDRQCFSTLGLMLVAILVPVALRVI